MKTLIIYDTKGTVIITKAGEPAPAEPSEIPFIWTDIPDGKQCTSIDVSVTPNVAVLEDLPKSEVELLKEQMVAMQDAVNAALGL